MIKHAILPTCASWMAQTTWRFSCLELIAVVSVLHKKLEMSVYMHVDYDGSVVDNVMMKIVKLSEGVT